jgi:hypothetical protein
VETAKLVAILRSEPRARRTNLGLEARNYAGAEGVAEAPHHAQLRVVLDQPAQIQSGGSRQSRMRIRQKKDANLLRISSIE